MTGLFTTDNTEFEAEAKYSEKKGSLFRYRIVIEFILDDWGFRNNHYGVEGQRINQYSKPLDEWCYYSLSFKPRARLIPELGEQLIKNESIAFLELVKNSYDACAKKL